jgi:hypothetical protein
MFRRFVSGFKPGRVQRDEHSEEGAIANYILVPSVVPECLPNEAGDQSHDADRRAVRDNAACPQMLWYKSAANAETRESATAASGLKEGQQVRLGCLRGSWACRAADPCRPSACRSSAAWPTVNLRRRTEQRGRPATRRNGPRRHPPVKPRQLSPKPAPSMRR